MKILFLILTILACSLFNYSQSNSERTKIESDIRAVMNDQAASWNAGDIEGFMRGYWNSEKLVFVSSGGVTRGWQQTLDRYKTNYDSRAKMGTLKFSDLEISILTRDSAAVLGSWSLTRENDNPKGKFTLIFRKFKNEWRIVHDHTS